MDKVLSLRIPSMENGSDALEIMPRPIPAAAPASAPAAPAASAAAVPEEPDFSTAMAELQQIRSELAEMEKKLGETKVGLRKSDRTVHFLRTVQRWNGLGPKIGDDMELGCLGLVIRRQSTPDQYQAFKEGLNKAKKRMETMMKGRLGRDLAPPEKERIRRMALIGGILGWYQKEGHAIKKRAARQGSKVFRLRTEERMCWRKVGFFSRFLAFSLSRFFSFFLSFFLSSFLASLLPPISSRSY